MVLRCYIYMNSVVEKPATKENFVSIAGGTLLNAINQAIEDTGSCVVGLSGGGTPKPIYTWLGKQESINWKQVSFFLVDERYISHTDTRSNTNMIQKTLLAGGLIHSDHVLSPATDLPLAECIVKYESDVSSLLEKNGGVASIIVLGIGSDGHIASLFPPLTNEQIEEGSQHKIFYTQTNKFDVKERITISLRQIRAADCKLFFLTGEEKETVWNEMKKSPYNQYKRWPSLFVVEGGKNIAITCFPSSNV